MKTKDILEKLYVDNINGYVMTRADMELFLKLAREEAISEHEASKKVIKAKALRKKGTALWYELLEDLSWVEVDTPNTWTENDDILLITPYDGEVVDVEIIIKEGGEG